MSPFLALTQSIEHWGIWEDGHVARLLFALGFLVILAVVFRVFVSRVLSRALARAVSIRLEERAAIERRVRTLATTLNWGFRVLLVFVAAGLILSEFGLNVSALVASVGIVGIALGLGAQTLVKDVLNGMFILIEDQYAVGDTVTVANITGEVVEINPRRTVLRDSEGNVHTIPNSAITVATNRTAGLNRFVIELEVPFREADQAAAIVNRVCLELAAERGNELTAHPRLVQQEALPGGQVGLKVAGDSHSAAKWSLEADLRRRLKRAFDAERLEMEFAGDRAGK
ncbi:mechanosensitive ion channel family protein [Candidatus Amarobacter glycogenicus]|uniref:mechanosensitive ion channel family protein n=1 Tax=Candidatus Amarobacter glycogenicus TaxID=3140699 RepID=UPI0031357276|nr:mechanosensitive ion channel family protein [Dehalococcoidia bacterium]